MKQLFIKLKQQCFLFVLCLFSLLAITPTKANITKSKGYTYCIPIEHASNSYYVFDWKSNIVLHDGNRYEEIIVYKEFGGSGGRMIETKYRKNQYGTIISYIFVSTPQGDFLTYADSNPNGISLNYKLSCKDEAG